MIRARDPLLADLERYTLHVGHVSAQEYQRHLAEALHEDAMPTLTLRELYIRELEAAGRERWLAEGLEQGLERGLEQGLEQGRVEHARGTLTLLLTRRFGPVSSDVESRVARATLAELDAALERVVDASSLAQVFDP